VLALIYQLSNQLLHGAVQHIQSGSQHLSQQGTCTSPVTIKPSVPSAPQHTTLPAVTHHILFQQGQALLMLMTIATL
jgi:hypothetical protein